VSIRVNVTFAGASFAFFETRTRPTEVAAHSVPRSCPRPSAATFPPMRVVSNVASVSFGPIATNSPQAPVKSASLVPNWFVVLQ